MTGRTTIPNSEPARFKIGQRVQTALYGRALIESYYRDRNTSWTYTLLLDEPLRSYVAKLRDGYIRLVEAAIVEIPAVVLLAELA
jgi:hypothetical protein